MRGRRNRSGRILVRILGISLLLVAATAWGSFELGVILGEPTGISGKAWTGATTAIDGAVAWSLSGANQMHIHGDFLIHDFGLLGASDRSVPFYYGIGGRIVSADETSLGARIPVGVGYYPPDIPLGLFLELVPVLDLLPDVELDMDGAVGVRYVF
jgi:hypothetical protein